MGWLGWTEEQTLDTTMRGIWLAYEGRGEMLKAIFGGGKDKAGRPLAEPDMPATKENILSVFQLLKGAA